MPQETPTPAIYSQNLKTKGQTYFFEGHRGTVTVFQSDMQGFLQAMAEAQDKVK